MVTRTIQFVEGEYYHIYNRGVDKRIIFDDVADHQRFQELLYLANSAEQLAIRNLKRDHKDIYEYEREDTLVAIGAYCLMPNHFHILVTPLVENGLSTFMSKLGTGYSMYFNKKHDMQTLMST